MKPMSSHAEEDGTTASVKSINRIDKGCQAFAGDKMMNFLLPLIHDITEPQTESNQLTAVENNAMLRSRMAASM